MLKKWTDRGEGSGCQFERHIDKSKTTSPPPASVIVSGHIDPSLSPPRITRPLSHEQLQSLVAANPSSPALSVCLARLQGAEALEALAPSLPLAKAALAELVLRGGKDEDAVSRARLLAREALAAGCADAAYPLGMVSSGEEAPELLARAEREATLFPLDAGYALALLHLSSKRFKEGIAQLSRGAKAGCPAAVGHLAVLLLEGGEVDKQKAVTMLAMASQAGNSRATVALEIIQAAVEKAEAQKSTSKAPSLTFLINAFGVLFSIFIYIFFLKK